MYGVLIILNDIFQQRTDFDSGRNIKVCYLTNFVREVGVYRLLYSISRALDALLKESQSSEAIAIRKTIVYLFKNI